MTNQEGQRADAETMAVCIDANQRIFMTLTIPTNIPLSNVKDFRVIRPAEPEKELAAKLLGVDLDTGLSFIRCVDTAPFKAISMVHATGLRVGEPVITVGLMAQKAGYGYMADMARVSARVGAPTQRVLVTGRTLGLGSAPVFNMAGQVVGLVSPERDAGGRIFIPIEEISHVVMDLPENGQYRPRAWLGLLRVGALPKKIIASRQIKRKAAILVVGLLPTGPAAKAGVKKDDVIVAVNGTSLKAFPALSMVVADFQRGRMRMKIGSKVVLTVVREEKEIEIPVTTEKAPLANSQLEREFVKEIGVGGRALSVIERHIQKVSATQGGLIVDYIRRGSVASRQFKPGDWVMKVNDKVLDTTCGAFGREVRKALADTARRDIAFQVKRRFQDGSIRDVILTFPKGTPTVPGSR